MAEEQARVLITKRGHLKARITKFSTDLSMPENRVNINELKLRYSTMEAIGNEFQNIQSEIELLDSPNFNNHLEERESFENKYFKIMGECKDTIDSLMRNQNSVPQIAGSNTSLQSQIKLPIIILPQFNGSYTGWAAFYDSYQSLVEHNNRLSNVEKFHYLKSCLVDEAKQVVDGLIVTAENYEIAWNLLRDRYENKRLISQHHISALFNLPAINKDAASSLRQLLDSITIHLKSLTILGLPTDQWDALIIHLITSKFDFHTKREWESQLNTKDFPTMESMRRFLSQRCQLLESLKLAKTNVPPNTEIKHKQNYKTAYNTKPVNTYVNQAQSTLRCVICKESHNIYKCDKFISLSVDKRLDEVKKHNLCRNCLKAKNHEVNKCYYGSCRRCNMKHNSLLHPELSENITSSQESLGQSSSSMVNNSTMLYHSDVLLSTALVKTLDRQGKGVQLRALLDSGSQSNFITRESCERLNLNLQNINQPVVGINGANCMVNQVVQLDIASFKSNFRTRISCLVIPKITNDMPVISFDKSFLNSTSKIDLADPKFNERNKIDLLLGSEIFWHLLVHGQIQLGKNKPILQKTKLGWIVGGPNTALITQRNQVACNVALSNLETQVEKFWEIENMGDKYARTAEEQMCEDHFRRTFKRDTDGHFIVSLPFKNNKPQLGNSRAIAFRRYISLENKLNRNPKLKLEYKRFIDEYINLGHMTLDSKLSNSNNEMEQFFFPHHAVIKESSLTTKLRVVFDGSAKTSNGKSLNDELMTGPVIQDDLFSLVLRFRTHLFALTADITKMYRQVRVDTEDRKYQKIMWRESSDDEIKNYILNTLTYGTSCAPFLAVRCLHQLADEASEFHNKASEVIKSDFYMDDLLTGTNDIAEAIDLRIKITEILAGGGFPLCKWNSNNINILPENTIQTESNLILDPNIPTKTLGLAWDSKNDLIHYNINDFHSYSNSIWTKRSILSAVAKIFDPLGLLGPIVVNCKLVLQSIWQLKLGWDDKIPDEIHSQWIECIQQLPNENSIKLCRLVIGCYPYKTIECHGFCDASQKAYGAAIYLKTSNGEGSHSVRLLCAKTRIAPLKVISIPKLELCAAVLLVKLKTKVKNSLRLTFTNIYLHTDSTIVLAWLAASPNTWQTFVANRVSEIQSNSKISEWYLVGSSDNPADIASRGALPNELRQSDLWWNGPKWLYSENAMQQPNTSYEILEDIPERKTTALITTKIDNTELKIFKNYSTFHKLQRVLAYCRRFIHNCRSKEKRIGILSSLEYDDSLVTILKHIQKINFSQELHELLSGKSIQNKAIKSLNVFLDSKKLIRVGGRLKNASIARDKKYPILLPKTNHITKLIIREIHIKYLHAGTQATLYAVRQRFWPISAKHTVKKIIHDCIVCYRSKPILSEQIMGNLPNFRVQPSRPFANSGVDYAGPILIKESKGRGKRTIKSYIALFICLSTKAVHLELVTDCSSESFLNALKRFMSRRGKPCNLYSDNASNFLGANKELQSLNDLFRSRDFGKITGELTRENIHWHFIPPRSPHFGGIWEAGIKSTKFHLKRVVGNSVLTYEEMYTLLTLIEAILNSRPLTPLSSDPNDLAALTPGHFLIGAPLTVPAEPDLTHLKMNRLSRWQLVQQCQQHFWKRRQFEYLTSLQQRPKWIKLKNNLQPGSLVLLHEDNLPPLYWRLGRIIECHAGNDGLTRVVSVKTQRGTIKRAVRKVSLLPIDTSESD